MFSAALAAAVQSDAAAKVNRQTRESDSVSDALCCAASGLVGRAVAVRPLNANALCDATARLTLTATSLIFPSIA